MVIWRKNIHMYCYHVWVSLAFYPSDHVYCEIHFKCRDNHPCFGTNVNVACHHKQHCQIEPPTFLQKLLSMILVQNDRIMWGFCEATNKNKMQSFTISIFTRSRTYMMANSTVWQFISTCSYILIYFWVFSYFNSNLNRFSSN